MVRQPKSWIKVFSGSKNKLNTARAAIEALAEVSTPHIFGKAEAAPVEAPKEEVK
jgi:ribosomal protein S5